MKRTPVDSSNLASVGYDATNQTLEIEFQNRSIYQYSNVPESVYRELMQADSHGTYFNQNIKGAYLYHKVSR
ncbi:KTSC domain-containing protein [Herpetosiphon llansteffanensis]|uniref:KTSC domain-containing protein n=1 Tax=Herpetosiphon llansteffanensis TaxID=2094568 RepID=UPI000D7C6AF6|nr:KTSC domain-containing protein [Herpetosiphon llansteffanensis]